jgi:hypothetical protein
MAIVEFNYYYEAEALLKGNRKPRLYLFENSIFLDIPEYHESCETVAMLLEGLEKNNFIPDNDLEKNVIITPYVKHNEKLWTPFVQISENNQYESSQYFQKEISELFCNINPENLLSYENITIDKPTKIFSLNPNRNLAHLQIKMENNEKKIISNIQSEDDVKILISNNKKQIEDSIIKNVKDNLCFLNGQLYRTTNGPLRDLPRPEDRGFHIELTQCFS